MRTHNRRQDAAILLAILLAGTALLTMAVNASNPSNWVLHGAAMFSVYAPVLTWRQGSRSWISVATLVLLGILFPIWGMWAALPSGHLAEWTSSAWPNLADVVASFAGLGGVQGLITAIVLRFACGSIRLSLAVAVAFIPAHLIGMQVSEWFPPPYMTTLGPHRSYAPFLPPIVVTWNVWVAVSMWAWSCSKVDLTQATPELSKNK